MNAAVNSYASTPARWSSESCRPAPSYASAAIHERPPGVVPASGPDASPSTRSPAIRIAGRTPGTRWTNEPEERPRLQRPRQRPEPAEVDVDLAQALERGGQPEVLGAADRDRLARAAGDHERAHPLGRAHGDHAARRGRRGCRPASRRPATRACPPRTSSARRPARSSRRRPARRPARRLQRQSARQRARREVVAHGGQQRGAGALSGRPELLEDAADELRLARRVHVRAPRGDRRRARRASPISGTGRRWRRARRRRRRGRRPCSPASRPRARTRARRAARPEPPRAPAMRAASTGRAPEATSRSAISRPV